MVYLKGHRFVLHLHRGILDELLRPLIARHWPFVTATFHDAVAGLEIGTGLADLKIFGRLHRGYFGGDGGCHELIDAGAQTESGNLIVELVSLIRITARTVSFFMGPIPQRVARTPLQSRRC